MNLNHREINLPKATQLVQFRVLILTNSGNLAPEPGILIEKSGREKGFLNLSSSQTFLFSELL